MTDAVTISTRYEWDCPDCGEVVQVPYGEEAPNRGDQVQCDVCGWTGEAGETR